MGFFKKLASVFGFGEEVVNTGIGEDNNNHQPRFRETGLPRKGFGVPVHFAVERSHLGPVLQPCSAGDGGIQGLRWYAKRLRVDEDGDVADEFLEEGLKTEKPENEEDDDQMRRGQTKPARVRGLVVSCDGKLKAML